MKYGFSVNFDRLTLLSDGTGYTGNLDTYDCGFTFSDEWEGYEKFITVIQGSTTYTDKITDDKYTMPALEAGEISVGLFGTSIEGKRICTNLLTLKYENGAYSTADPPVPEPDVWMQYVTEMTEKFDAKGTELAELFEAKKAELEESFTAAANEIMDAKVPQKATEAQALEGTDDAAYITPLQGKNQFNHLIAGALTNIPEIYTKETTAGMESITGMKHGDMCIILSGNTTAQSVYRYYTKDIEGSELTSPQWVWVSDLSLFAPQPVLNITDGIWDYSLGNSARITIYSAGDDSIDSGGDSGFIPGFDDTIQTFSLVTNNTITITNVYSGAYGVLDVYGDGKLVLPENSYTVPPDWNYLAPNAGQHYRYSFYYDGTKFDWNRSVRYDA